MPRLSMPRSLTHIHSGRHGASLAANLSYGKVMQAAQLATNKLSPLHHATAPQGGRSCSDPRCSWCSKASLRGRAGHLVLCAVLSAGPCFVPAL